MATTASGATNRGRVYDLFITHAWRYHDDWKRLSDLLNRYEGGLAWRNFSLPWFDPALNPGSDAGGRALRANLEHQILPVHAVVLLASLFDQPGARRWVDYEIDVARRHRKPIIALPRWGEGRVPSEVEAVADDVVGWEVPALLGAIDGRLT